MKFLQIGTNNGADECYNIVKEHDIELGILVEPIPELRDKIKNQYKGINNINIESIAITPDNNISSIDLYKSKKEGQSSKTSFNKDMLLKHNVEESDIEKISYPAISVNDLLDVQSKNVNLLEAANDNYFIPYYPNVDENRIIYKYGKNTSS